MVQLAPSKNPEKESRQLGIIALICGIASLVLWFFAIAGLALGIRGAILSQRVKSKKYLVFSIIGAVLSIVSLTYYFVQ
jgi:hypothetical protein